jgi:hypothetical protein
MCHLTGCPCSFRHMHTYVTCVPCNSYAHAHTAAAQTACSCKQAPHQARPHHPLCWDPTVGSSVLQQQQQQHGLSTSAAPSSGSQQQARRPQGSRRCGGCINMPHCRQLTCQSSRTCASRTPGQCTQQAAPCAGFCCTLHPATAEQACMHLAARYDNSCCPASSNSQHTRASRVSFCHANNAGGSRCSTAEAC